MHMLFLCVFMYGDFRLLLHDLIKAQQCSALSTTSKAFEPAQIITLRKYRHYCNLYHYICMRFYLAHL